MADTKLIDLPALATPSSDDLLYIVDDPAGTPISKRITYANLTAGLGGAGAVVQVKSFQTGAIATGTSIIPLDDTIPQITEGNEYMTLAITPTSATNLLKIDIVFFCSGSTANWVTVALFQDSTANALAAYSAYGNINGSERNSTFSHTMTAGTTSATTFRVRAGRDASASSTVTFNGAAGARYFGGVVASSITITEIDPTGSGGGGGGGGVSVLDELADVTAPTPAHGNVLTYDSGLPGWMAATPSTPAGGSGLVLLQTVSAVASASLEFTALSSAYTNYIITVTNYVAVTDAANVLLTLAEGGVYHATAYRWISAFNGTTTAWGNTKSASDTSIRLWGSQDSVVPIQMTITVLGTTHAGGYATVHAELAGFNGSAEFFAIDTKGIHAVTAAIDRIKLTNSTGNILTGVARLYGLAQ